MYFTLQEAAHPKLFTHWSILPRMWQPPLEIAPAWAKQVSAKSESCQRALPTMDQAQRWGHKILWSVGYRTRACELEVVYSRSWLILTEVTGFWALIVWYSWCMQILVPLLHSMTETSNFQHLYFPWDTHFPQSPQASAKPLLFLKAEVWLTPSNVPFFTLRSVAGIPVRQEYSLRLLAAKREKHMTKPF